MRLWFVVKVNCEALEPWQGSRAETRHARAEPSDRYRSCPGWLWGSLRSRRGGTGTSGGHFSPDLLDVPGGDERSPGDAGLSPPTAA